MAKMALRVSRNNNFIWLLAGLVFFLFAGAVARQLELENTNRIVNFALMLTLVVNIWFIEGRQTQAAAWKVFATIMIAGTMITDSVIASNVLAKFQLFMTFTFLALTLWQAWSQVMFTGVVDRNTIIGSVCIYLLMGLLWAFAYLIVEAFLPGSMKGLDHDLWQNNTTALVYYSLVTLTTLGYGDISPAQPITQFLAYMEAVTGVFYMAVLVASLIGIRLAGAAPSGKTGEFEAKQSEQLTAEGLQKPQE